MEILDALVVVKRSALERLAPQRDKVLGESRASLEQHAMKHKNALDIVRKVLKKRGIRADVVWRAGLPKIIRRADTYDLVITIGGDGTLLRSSHFIKNALALGLNSNPSHSVGMLCGANPYNFEEIIENVCSGKLKPLEIHRAGATISGRPVCPPALNDILFAHRVPAATSRYVIKYRGKKEEQKSSGVWLATAAGSTAAAMSAGAKPLPIASRKLQFIVRELYHPRTKGSLRLGALQPGEKLEIRSTTIDGAIYIDGQPSPFHVPFGVNVSFSLYPYPLRLLGYNRNARENFMK